VVAVEAGGLLGVLALPESQEVLEPAASGRFRDGYAYMVPYVEAADHCFLKRVIPSRKATRDYLKTEEPDDTA
jgi:hypothetical protein